MNAKSLVEMRPELTELQGKMQELNAQLDKVESKSLVSQCVDNPDNYKKVKQLIKDFDFSDDKAQKQFNEICTEQFDGFHQVMKDLLQENKCLKDENQNMKAELQTVRNEMDEMKNIIKQIAPHQFDEKPGVCGQVDKYGPDIWYCIGKNNGCISNGKAYGSNPYNGGSDKCVCARHSGVITEQGGYFKIIICKNDSPFRTSGSNRFGINS